DAIRAISTGKKWASGSGNSSSQTLPFTTDENTTTSKSYVKVTGLDFKPSFVIIQYSDGIPLKETTLSDTKIPGANNEDTKIQSVITGYRLTGNAYTIFGEFQLPIDGTTSLPVNWFAFE